MVKKRSPSVAWPMSEMSAFEILKIIIILGSKYSLKRKYIKPKICSPFGLLYAIYLWFLFGCSLLLEGESDKI